MSPAWILMLTLMSVAMTRGAKVLGVFPVPARSHLIVQKSLMFELARRGHEVTVVSSFPENKAIPNYTDIELKTSMKDLMGSAVPKNWFEMESQNQIQMTFMMLSLGEAACHHVLQEENVQKLIHSTDLHFDLVVIEAFFNECFLGFAHKFQAPLVQVCTYGGSNFMADWVGSPNPYSFVPDEFIEYTDKMNFWQRMYNSVLGTLKHVGKQLIHLPRQNAALLKYFNYTDNLPSVWELEYKTSLVLLNTHHSLSYPKPLMPNYVQVGGMHVEPPKKLPQDLQKYLDEALDGVIYFCMGSNLRSTSMPESKRNAFLGAFSKVKQHVLWKWESDTLPGQPSNVKLGKWLPQSDILDHPKIRLFITHGGVLSMQEAIHRGVPVLGIPIFADQSLNINKAVTAGYGISIRFNNVTSESLLWGIKEMIDNPKYHENAQRLSRIYRDQPRTPLEQAAYWTEYMIRHKGAPHLRSAVLDLAWYQYLLLDVIAVLALAVGSVVLVVYMTLRAVFGKICGGGRHKDDDKILRKNKRD